jgi:dynein heavy chain, axonemal
VIVCVPRPLVTDALRSVADSILMNVDLGNQPNAMAHISVMSAHVHLTVRDNFAERFRAEQRRRQYVTPRTFVELLMVFSQTVVKKRTALEASIERLESGLKKLDNAEVMIDKLQAGRVPPPAANQSWGCSRTSVPKP